MNYFFWIILAIGAYYNIKFAKSRKSRIMFIGLYSTILIIGFAYMSGEKIGEALYHITH